MDYILECLDKYEELPLDYKDVFASQETQNLINKLEAKFKVELSFLLILLAIEELYLEDVEEYLAKKFELEANKIDIIKNEISDKILKKAQAIFQKIEAKRQEEVINEKEIVLSVFASNLLTIFKMPAGHIKGLNIIIFSLFNKDLLLEEKVINALYNNQELISQKTINLEGREVKASIANYLKDFIKNYGSEMPDNLVLANYLNSSVNVKKLSPQEKSILNRVLKTYKNLVFFPESMERIPMENWELIASSSKDAVEQKDALDDDNISALQKTKEVIQTELKEDLNEKDKEVKSAKTRLEDLSFKDLDELNRMLKEYPLNSLEYRAIKEEINRLRKRQ